MTFQELLTDSWSCSGEWKTTKHFTKTSLFPGLLNRVEVHLLYPFISWCSLPEAAFKVTHSRCPHSSGLHYPHIHNQSPAVSEISHNITNIVAPRLLSLILSEQMTSRFCLNLPAGSVQFGSVWSDSGSRNDRGYIRTDSWHLWTLSYHPHDTQLPPHRKYQVTRCETAERSCFLRNKKICLFHPWMFFIVE